MTVRDLLPFGRSSVPILRGVHPIRAFQEEMNHLFDDFFGESSWPSLPSSWLRRTPEPAFAISPPLDVAENDKAFTISTRAASGIAGFEQIIQVSQTKAPLHRIIDLNDIGAMAAFLVSGLSKNITGGIHLIDAGYEVMD